MEPGTKIRLRIGLTDSQMNEKVLESIRKAEAGEIVSSRDAELNFQSWEHFIYELAKDDPEMTTGMLSIPEEERSALFDTPAGQSALQRIWAAIAPKAVAYKVASRGRGQVARRRSPVIPNTCVVGDDRGAHLSMGCRYEFRKHRPLLVFECRNRPPGRPAAACSGVRANVLVPGPLPIPVAGGAT